MKILNYYITRLVLWFNPNKTIEMQETSFWGTLTLLNCYVGYFVFLPLTHILIGDKIFYSISGKESGLYFLLPLFLFDLFYFFWDTRWLKLYEEVQQWPKEKIIKQRNILLISFFVVTILSIIYKYLYFPFGRW